MQLLGRLSRTFEFRRPLMGVLNEVYRFANWPRGGFVNMAMSYELLISVCLLPLAYTDLRAGLSGLATVSDASQEGGGVCASTGLGDAARRALAVSRDAL